jgi:type II secretory pathway component PulF
MSSFLSENIVTIIFGSLALGLIFVGYTRTEMGKYRWDMQKLLFPLTGHVYKNYLIVRTMSTFHLLTSSGVSIVKTLRLTGESSGNTVIKKLYGLISDDVAHGMKISESMRNQDREQVFFTPDILQMIESSERTSTMDSVTDRISIQYKREVDVALNMMVKFIEPTALLLAGLFVLWFAIAIFSAIMQIVSLAGN